LTVDSQTSRLAWHGTARNRLAVLLCIVVNLIDGFDSVLGALVAPVLAREWSIAPTILGIFLSSSLIGQTLGTAVMSPFADKYGRRNLIIYSQVLVVVAMTVSVFAPTIEVLMLARLVAGVGIGSTHTLVIILGAEHTPQDRKSMAVIYISAGTTVGFILGGLGAIPLLAFFSWRVAFAVAALATLLVLAAIILWLPESEEYLSRRAARKNSVRRAPIAQVLRGVLLRGTILLGLCCISVGMASHFIVQWTPHNLVSAGLSLSGGLSGSVLVSAGMLSGMLAFGYATTRWDLKRLGAAVMVLCFVAASAFALAPAKLELLVPLALGVGCLMGPALGAVYAMVAKVFPPEVRATGSAVALGIGRAGSVLGPILGGVLVDSGMSRAEYSIILATPFLLGAVLLAFTPTQAEPRGS
jgi:MFS family permease